MSMTFILYGETRYCHHWFHIPTTSAFILSFFHPLMPKANQSFTMCSVFISSFSDLSFLHPKVPSHFLGSFPLGKKQAIPCSVISQSCNLPLTPHLILAVTPVLCILPRRTSPTSCLCMWVPLVSSHSIVSLLSLVYSLWLHKLVFVKTIVNP